MTPSLSLLLLLPFLLRFVCCVDEGLVEGRMERRPADVEGAVVVEMMLRVVVEVLD